MVGLGGKVPRELGAVYGGMCVCVWGGGGGSCQRRKQDREVKSTFRGERGKVILLTNDGNEMEKAKGKGRRER